MTYSISSVSNRDLQLLYQYRILRQPSDLLKAVYTGSTPEVLTFSAGVAKDDYFEYRWSIKVPDNKVPMLEFVVDDTSRNWLATLLDVTVDSSSITVTSTKELLEGLQVKVYWVDSLDTIRKVLDAYKTELTSLQQQLEELDTKVSNLDFSGQYLDKPNGVPDNLVKLTAKSDGSLGLGDSEYRITTAIDSQSFTNPTAEFLARMVKDIADDIAIMVTDAQPRTLQDLVGGGRITISGNGTWYLINVANDVLFYNFTGSIYALNCASVRTFEGTICDTISVVNSCLVHNRGITDKLTLARHALVKHNSGTIRKLLHVGVGCEYYSAVAGSKAKQLEPKFTWSSIQGTVCLANGQIIMNGRDISFITGHHDDPLQPSKLTLVVSPGGEDPTVPNPS